VQCFSRRDQDRQVGSCRQQAADTRGVIKQVFKVIKDQEQGLVVEVCEQLLVGLIFAVECQAHRLGNRGKDQIAARDRL
jgi:hypothetical protein